jgi:hypothetical protein
MRAVQLRRRVDEVKWGDAWDAAVEWKSGVVEALVKGGSSDHNLTAFVEGISSDVH